jgi:ArsR family transcriptional regulator, arsenate/arsenite/antimonite-responsive transcriptional repressor
MDDAVRTLKALADPVRLRIVLLLAGRELCVCELEAVLRIEQSLLSHHLGLLRRAGLVDDRKDGRWTIYALAGEARGLVVGPLLRGGLGLEASKAVRDDKRRVGDCVRRSVRNRGARAGRSRNSR